jgi:hypothetical protein
MKSANAVNSPCSGRRPTPNRRIVADRVRTLIELINASALALSLGVAITAAYAGYRAGLAISAPILDTLV